MMVKTERWRAAGSVSFRFDVIAFSSLRRRRFAAAGKWESRFRISTFPRPPVVPSRSALAGKRGFVAEAVGLSFPRPSGLPASGVARRNRRLHLALAQQFQLGRPHLAGTFHIAHSLRLFVQLDETDARLRMFTTRQGTRRQWFERSGSIDVRSAGAVTGA